jgi:hypothetical protein
METHVDLDVYAKHWLAELWFGGKPSGLEVLCSVKVREEWRYTSCSLCLRGLERENFNFLMWKCLFQSKITLILMGWPFELLLVVHNFLILVLPLLLGIISDVVLLQFWVVGEYMECMDLISTLNFLRSSRKIGYTFMCFVCMKHERVASCSCA